MLKASTYGAPDTESWQASLAPLPVRSSEALVAAAPIEVRRLSSPQIPDEGLDGRSCFRVVPLAAILTVDGPRSMQDVGRPTESVASGSGSGRVSHASFGSSELPEVAYLCAAV